MAADALTEAMNIEDARLLRAVIARVNQWVREEGGSEESADCDITPGCDFVQSFITQREIRARFPNLWTSSGVDTDGLPKVLNEIKLQSVFIILRPVFLFS